MTEWEQMSTALAGVRRWEVVDAQAALDEVLDHNGGTLPRDDATMLAERTGWSVRQMYRWKATRDRRAPHGEGTFLDRLVVGGRSAFVFDDLALTMLYLVGGNMARFREEVMSAGYPMPSLPTLSRRWRSTVPRHVRDGARHGQRNRHANLFYVRHSAAEVDEAWQLDAFNLDLRVLAEALDEPDPDDPGTPVVVREGGRWKKIRPQLLLLIDDLSRYIPAWALLDHEPTAADTCALLADAFEVRPDDQGSGVLVGGVCDKLICDNATAFRSLLVEGMMVDIGAQVAPTPVYSPAAKGKVERVGQTVQSRIVTGIAGVVSQAERFNTRHALDVAPAGWLRFDQLESIVAEAVHAYNYETKHSAHGRTPFDVYSDRPGPRRVLSDETLAAHYLPVARAGGRRKLQPSGVFAFGEYWLDPNFDTNLIGTEVTVRSLHHRLDRLAVFTSSDEFAGMAVRASTLSAADRERLVGERLEQTMSVARYAKWARAALQTRTAGIATGGSGSLVDAASDALDTTGADVPDPPEDRGEPGDSGARPKRRPPRQNNDTTGVPAARPARKRTSRTTADREAALDAEASKAKKRSPRKGKK